MSGSGISWAICKSAPCSRQITMPAPHHSVFYRPDALHAAQPTVSKHWSHLCKNAEIQIHMSIFSLQSVSDHAIFSVGLLTAKNAHTSLKGEVSISSHLRQFSTWWCYLHLLQSASMIYTAPAAVNRYDILPPTGHTHTFNGPLSGTTQVSQ